MAGFRWGTYERISDDRREGAGLGIQRQRKDIREKIVREDPGGVVVEDYADNDISAYSGKRRPAYERMLADVRSGRINAIGTWHHDRLHRSPRELEDFIDLIEERHVRILTVQAGEMDLSTPTGQLVARQLGSIARYESAHKARRIRAKHAELAAAGKPSGGNSARSYGYQPVFDRPERPRKLVDELIVPAEAQVIRECARRVLAGESLSSVTDDLNARGIVTVSGGRWYRTTLARVLASAKIAGLREHRPGTRNGKVPLLGEITAPGTWKPIITVAQSDALRRMLADPDRRTSPGPTGRWLCAGGVLACGLCGGFLVGRLRPGRPGQYICLHRARPGNCGRVSILAPGTEEVITDWVASALAGDAWRRALRRLRGDVPDETALLEEIVAAEAELGEWARDKASGTVSRKEWLAGTGTARRRLERAQAQLSRDNPVIDPDGLPSGAEDLRRWLLDASVPVSRRRAVISAVLEKVTVAPAERTGRPRFDPSRLHPIWKA